MNNKETLVMERLTLKIIPFHSVWKTARRHRWVPENWTVRRKRVAHPSENPQFRRALRIHQKKAGWVPRQKNHRLGQTSRRLPGRWRMDSCRCAAGIDIPSAAIHHPALLNGGCCHTKPARESLPARTLMP